jgi:hypothetical protein
MCFKQSSVREKFSGKIFCTTFAQKCDGRGSNITVNLEFRKFADNKLQENREFCEILYIMKNKFQRSH